MAAENWKVELHAHTIYSKDSVLKLDRIAAMCQSKGIDKLAITDHNTVAAALELARRYPMLIIPGLEVMTTKGELLAWYVTGEVPRGLSPQETIARLRDQGAVIGVSHPMDRYRRGAWNEADLLEIVEDVDAIEVFNARCLQAEDNVKALAFAQQHGKLMTCGSDAHAPYEYGRATLSVAPFSNNAAGFKQALAQASRVEQLSPFFVHFFSRWAVYRKRLGLAARPGRASG